MYVVEAVLRYYSCAIPDLATVTEMLAKLESISTYGGAWSSIVEQIRADQVPGYKVESLPETDEDGWRRVRVLKS